MSAIDNRPPNLNLLSQVGFKFELARSPNFNYFIQKIDFPGMSLPTVPQANPFIKVPIPGDHIDFDSVKIYFKLDEDLRGYFEMYDWITALGKPENFSGSAAIYDKLAYDKASVFSDASLIILNNKMMPNINITFYEMLPIRLGGFTLETDATDINYLSSSLELRYRMYKYDYVT